MEEDTEVLDWELPEEMNQEASRRVSYDHGGPCGESGGEDDDIEDAVSLGDEEDQAPYYHSGDVTVNNHGSYVTQEVTERPPSAQRHVGALGANDQRRSQDVFHDRERSTRSTNQLSIASPESPPGWRGSKNQTPPQLMQANTTRLTHALPPKPVMVNTGLLTPSQSSIAQATRMTSMSPRTAAREAKKLPPTPGKPAPTSTTPEPPKGRELRRSRESDQQNYYSRDTHESQRTFPVSNLPSNSSHGTSQSRHRRGSTSDRRVSPSDSDPHHSQTSRLNRHSSRVQPENGSRETIRSRTPDADNLSYKDRHYRPAEAPSVDVEARIIERSEVIGDRITSNSRYDRSPPKSPTRRRRRAGSYSPPGVTRPPPQQHAREKDCAFLRGNLRPAGRERNSYTNTDPAIQRDQEVTQPRSGHTGRNWVAPHMLHPDFSRGELDARRLPYRASNEDVRLLDAPPADNRNRPPPRGRANSREVRRDRDREPTRHTDMRGQLNNQSFASAPRTRSPPPRELDQGRDYAGYQDSISAPLPNRMERSFRFDRSLSSNGPPPPNGGLPPREVPESRSRDYDSRPAPNPDERHRGSEREYDRPRRDFPESMEQPRRTDTYHSDAARPLDRSRRYQEESDRLTTHDGPQSSQMKRRPLPPQTDTYKTSSATISVYRDPPPHSIAVPPGRDSDRRGKLPDDSNALRRPRYGSNSPPRAENHGGVSRQLDTGRNIDLAPHARVPPHETQMDIDPDPLQRPNYLPSANNPRASRPQAEERSEPLDGPHLLRSHPLPKRVDPNTSEYLDFGLQGRSFQPPPAQVPTRYDQKGPDDVYPNRDQSQFERWPMSQGKRGPLPRRDVRIGQEVSPRPPPPVHTSGTNNIPIGIRRGLGPPGNPPVPSLDGPLNLPHMEFDPGARPPPSTLIRPAKSHELRPGKESYERPQGMAIPDGRPRRMSFSEAQPQRRRSPPPHQIPSLPPKPQPLLVTEPERQRRMDRKTRFDQPAPPPPGRNRVPDHLDNTSDNDAPQRHTTPPSRDLTMMLSARHSDMGHNSDSRSDNSRSGVQECNDIVPVAPSNSQRPQETSPAASVSQESGNFNPELLMNPASLRRVGSRLGDYDKPRYASVLGPYQYFLDDEPQPNLSRRLSHEKPPRHRKYQSESLNGVERAEALGQTSPENSGGRESQDDRSIHFKGRTERAPQPSQKQGTKISLLERLSLIEDNGNGNNGSDQSLRDRLVPSKRDRDDMRDDGDGRELSCDGEDGNDHKRVKRRTGKGRRGGRK